MIPSAAFFHLLEQFQTDLLACKKKFQWPNNTQNMTQLGLKLLHFGKFLSIKLFVFCFSLTINSIVNLTSKFRKKKFTQCNTLFFLISVRRDGQTVRFLPVEKSGRIFKAGIKSKKKF